MNASALLLLAHVVAAEAYVPCAAPPDGMTCIAGGLATVGRDDGPANERPRRSIEVSTFYVDRHPATNAQYRACVEARACPARRASKASSIDGDAVALDYARAHAYCGWTGKRLATEWEWEKAASAPVGVIELAGGREWSSSWSGAAWTGPCTQCSGRDPMGLCTGTDPCPNGGRKILRGGTASSRTAADAVLGRGGVRCASTSTRLWGFPTALGTEVRPAPAPLIAPTLAQRQAAHDIVEDALDKQECDQKGRSFIDCRDPNSYIKTNEPRQSLWTPFIANLGGGYTGVGIDQNYSLMAVQKAEWGWLFDYDPTVVRLHHALRALILDAPDRASFLTRFDDANQDASLAVIAAAYADDREQAAYREVYAVSRTSLGRYYRKQLRGERDDPGYGWLATEDAYAYVRAMFQQDRIVLLKGDMLAKDTMQGIARAARTAGVIMRVYYPSNAPEFWPLSQQYKDNVTALPFDDRSVVLQTFSRLAPGFGEKKTGHWHYNVQAGLQQQELMRRRGVGSLPQLVNLRNKTDDPDLTVSGLVRAP